MAQAMKRQYVLFISFLPIEIFGASVIYTLCVHAGDFTAGANDALRG
jgi:hypothetical protein